MSDDTPQGLLDQLNEIGIPNLFDVDKSSKERLAEIKLARQKVRLIKQRLNQEKENISGRWDGRNRQQAVVKRLELAPLDALSDIVGQVEVMLTELETAVKTEGPIPNRPTIASIVAGGAELGWWSISSPETAVTRLREEIDATRKNIRSVLYLLLPLLFWGVMASVFLLAALYFGLTLDGKDPSIAIVTGLLGLGAIWVGFAQMGQRKRQQEPFRNRLRLFHKELARVEQLIASRSVGIEPSVIPSASTSEHVRSAPTTRPANLRPQLEAARALINSRQYEAARNLLQSIDHPKAREWIEKIDRLNTPVDRKYTPEQSQRLVESRQHFGDAIQRYRASNVARVGINTCNDEHVCPACRQLAGKTYSIDEVPSLPYEHCTSDGGCRCWIKAVL